MLASRGFWKFMGERKSDACADWSACACAWRGLGARGMSRVVDLPPLPPPLPLCRAAMCIFTGEMGGQPLVQSGRGAGRFSKQGLARWLAVPPPRPHLTTRSTPLNPPLPPTHPQSTSSPSSGTWMPHCQSTSCGEGGEGGGSLVVGTRTLTLTPSWPRPTAHPPTLCSAFGCDAPIGLIYSINPAMIVLLVPLVGAMTTGERVLACCPPTPFLSPCLPPPPPTKPMPASPPLSPTHPPSLTPPHPPRPAALRHDPLWRLCLSPLPLLDGALRDGWEGRHLGWQAGWQAQGWARAAVCVGGEGGARRRGKGCLAPRVRGSLVLGPPLPLQSRPEWATALFVAMLSLGEAIWSPRW